MFMQKFEGSSFFLRLKGDSGDGDYLGGDGAIVVSGWIGYDRDGAFVLKGSAVPENRKRLVLSVRKERV